MPLAGYYLSDPAVRESAVITTYIVVVIMSQSLHNHLTYNLLLLTVLLKCFGSVANAGQPQWVAGWKPQAGLNVARAGAAVVKAGSNIYVLGGVDGRDFLRSVEVTQINKDGSLSPWRLTRSLNEERGFFSAAVDQGYLYAIGGGNGPYGKHLLQSVERAKIQADGSLGPWKTLASQLALPRRCVKVLIKGKRIYALGGFGGTLLDSVESAAILAHGTLGPWRLETQAMTMPRYVNAAKRVGDLAIVIGGHRETEGVGLKAVEVAHLGDAGIKGQWQASSTLQYGRYGLSAASDGQTLWALGGLDGAIYSDRIEKATIKQAGPIAQRLGAWQETTALSSPRANFGVVVASGRMYIIGGTNRDGYYNSVELAHINDQGDIGFYGSVAQAAAYQQRNESKVVTVLPNGGQVIEVIQTSAYSYLKVEGDAGARWLAAPRGEYQQGDGIRYSRGLTMTNFFSRSLGRKFGEILFVERVDKE